MNIFYLNCCSKQIELFSEPKATSASRSCMQRNQDIIFIAVAIIFALCSVLSAYNYLPTGHTNPMFAAGSYATGASLLFVFGCWRALIIRRCIEIKESE